MTDLITPEFEVLCSVSDSFKFFERAFWTGMIALNAGIMIPRVKAMTDALVLGNGVIS